MLQWNLRGYFWCNWRISADPNPEIPGRESIWTGFDRILGENFVESLRWIPVNLWMGFRRIPGRDSVQTLGDILSNLRTGFRQVPSRNFIDFLDGIPMESLNGVPSFPWSGFRWISGLDSKQSLGGILSNPWMRFLQIRGRNSVESLDRISSISWTAFRRIPKRGSVDSPDWILMNPWTEWTWSRQTLELGMQINGISLEPWTGLRRTSGWDFGESPMSSFLFFGVNVIFHLRKFQRHPIRQRRGNLLCLCSGGKANRNLNPHWTDGIHRRQGKGSTLQCIHCDDKDVGVTHCHRCSPSVYQAYWP